MHLARFLEFLTFYRAVMDTPELTLAERTAAIEAAHDEYAQRANPPAFKEIADRLSRLPPRKHAEEPTPQAPRDEHSAQTKASPRTGPAVGPKPRR